MYPITPTAIAAPITIHTAATVMPATAAGERPSSSSSALAPDTTVGVTATVQFTVVVSSYNTPVG